MMPEHLSDDSYLDCQRKLLFQVLEIARQLPRVQSGRKLSEAGDWKLLAGQTDLLVDMLPAAAEPAATAVDDNDKADAGTAAAVAAAAVAAAMTAARAAVTADANDAGAAAAAVVVAIAAAAVVAAVDVAAVVADVDAAVAAAAAIAAAAAQTYAAAHTLVELGWDDLKRLRELVWTGKWGPWTASMKTS